MTDFELTITELWRYPVKSLRGEQLAAAHLTDTGIEGDRGWGIADLATGKVLTARREPAMLFASARLEGDEMMITLPDGSETNGDSALSSWLGRDVALLAAGDEGGVYECPIDPGVEQDWIEWQGPGDAWHDSQYSRLSLVSTATLGSVDVRRIRANIVCGGHGEDSLVGTTLAVGNARLTVMKHINRCVMVSRAQPGLEGDLDVLKTINAEREGNMSIGALVERVGTIRVGDEIHLG